MFDADELREHRANNQRHRLASVRWCDYTNAIYREGYADYMETDNFVVPHERGTAEYTAFDAGWYQAAADRPDLDLCSSDPKLLPRLKLTVFEDGLVVLS